MKRLRLWWFRLWHRGLSPKAWECLEWTLKNVPPWNLRLEPLPAAALNIGDVVRLVDPHPEDHHGKLWVISLEDEQVARDLRWCRLISRNEGVVTCLTEDGSRRYLKKSSRVEFVFQAPCTCPPWWFVEDLRDKLRSLPHGFGGGIFHHESCLKVSQPAPKTGWD